MNKKRGVSLIIAVLVIVMLGVIIGGIGAMGRLGIMAGQTMVITDDIFFIAESGIETGIDWLRNTDTDLNWYNNADSDGVMQPVLQYSLGVDRTVNVSVRYPATGLKTDVDDPSSTLYLHVYSVECFDEFGQINGGEYFYVKIGPDIARISYYDTSNERLVVYPGSDSFVRFLNPHVISEKVFPVAKVALNILSTDTVIAVSSTRGFLPAGTLILRNPTTDAAEYIRYSNKTQFEFLGCQRASNGSSALAASAGDVWQVVPVEYEATIYSKGTTQGLSKTLEVTVQYKNF